MTLHLTTEERAFLAGDHGEAVSLAMRILVSAAELLGAQALVRITSAHIDGCLHPVSYTHLTVPTILLV